MRRERVGIVKLFPLDNKGDRTIAGLGTRLHQVQNLLRSQKNMIMQNKKMMLLKFHVNDNSRS